MWSLVLLSLCALVVVCTAAPKEFTGPPERDETFMDKQAASNFVRRKRHAYGYYHHIPSYESYREIYKAPIEVHREYCLDDDEKCGKGFPYSYYGHGRGYGHGYGYGYAGYYSPYYSSSAKQ